MSKEIWYRWVEVIYKHDRKIWHFYFIFIYKEEENERKLIFLSFFVLYSVLCFIKIDMKSSLLENGSIELWHGILILNNCSISSWAVSLFIKSKVDYKMKHATRNLNFILLQSFYFSYQKNTKQTIKKKVNVTDTTFIDRIIQPLRLFIF